MKTLTLIRHAKSSWTEARLTDRERPLNERGLRDAPEMGRRLHERGVEPDLLIASPALRAQQTANIIAEALGFPADGVQTREDIYASRVETLLDLIQTTPDDASWLLLVGHNPEFTEMVGVLSDATVDNMPTCSVATIEFDVPSWSDVVPGVGRLADFDYPKKTRDATDS